MLGFEGLAFSVIGILGATKITIPGNLDRRGKTFYVLIITAFCNAALNIGQFVHLLSTIVIMLR